MRGATKGVGTNTS